MKMTSKSALNANEFIFRSALDANETISTKRNH